MTNPTKAITPRPSVAAHVACEALEYTLAEVLPHRFPEDFSHESLGFDKHFLYMPPAMLAEIIRWSISNPDDAHVLAGRMESP